MDDAQIKAIDSDRLWRQEQRRRHAATVARVDAIMAEWQKNAAQGTVQREVGFGSRQVVDDWIVDTRNSQGRVEVHRETKQIRVTWADGRVDWPGAVGSEQPATHSPEAGETIARAIRWHR